MPTAPVATPAPAQRAPGISPERRAEITDWVRDNASAQSRSLLVFTDSEGGSRVGRALRGESDLGRLTGEERDLLAKSAVDHWWAEKDIGPGSENLDEAAGEVARDPAARAALARAMATPELDVQRIFADGGSIMTTPEAGPMRFNLLERALKLDPGAVMGAAEGIEPQLASVASHMSDRTRGDMWAALADGSRVAPQTAERMATALFMFEDGDAVSGAEGRAAFASAIANARVPGDSTQDGIRRDQMQRNLTEALADGDARDMIFNTEITPEQRLWALDRMAGDGTSGPAARDFGDGWEGEAVTKAYAARATEAFRARGVEPQMLGGEALRNTVGQAMGLRPDQLPEGELGADFLARGMDNAFYSHGGDNAGLDAVANQIRAVGGDRARVTVVPVTVTNNDDGAAVVPVFRVENPQGGAAKFVDHTGRSYRDLADWEANNTLPKGRMSYAEGLDLRNEALSFRNTPGVVDSFGEAFGQTMDAVALGAGIVAGGVLIFGSGGSATPLVVAGGAALWGTGRAAQDLHDMATHGQDIGDLGDPAVRGAWLQVAAGALSVTAIGGAVRLGAKGAQVSPGMARMIAGTAHAADIADAATVIDQSVQLGMNWDQLSGADRAGALLNIAFWGGMGAASHVAGSRARGFADLDAGLRVRGMAGGDAAPVRNLSLAPGEIRVAYDTPAGGGRPANIRVETGPGVTDAAALARHQHLADQMRAAGGLRDRLGALLDGQPRPEPGSAAWEARLEIGKIETEAADLAGRAARGEITPEALATRQRELDQALIREQARLDAGHAMGQGFVAKPKSLDELLAHYSTTGDITLGVPARLAALTAPQADAPAHIDYGTLNAAGQAQGIEATITRDMLDTGSHAKGSIKPPGFINGRDHNHSRGHLLARMLGGDGADARNLVMLYQRDTNSPVMRDFEAHVYDAVSAGEVVNYKVTPIYVEGRSSPVSVALQAKGSQGLDISITIANIDKS